MVMDVDHNVAESLEMSTEGSLGPIRARRMPINGVRHKPYSWTNNKKCGAKRRDHLAVPPKRAGLACLAWAVKSGHSEYSHGTLVFLGVWETRNPKTLRSTSANQSHRQAF